MYQNACRCRQTVERNVFSLYFYETISRCIPTGLEKMSIGSSAAVHRSVGMLFVPRQKFGGRYRRSLLSFHSLMQKSKGLLEEGR